MALLRLNPPNTATRIDFGLVQPQDLSLVTGVIETMAPSYGVQRVEPLTWKIVRVSATHQRPSKRISYITFPTHFTSERFSSSSFTHLRSRPPGVYMG